MSFSEPTLLFWIWLLPVLVGLFVWGGFRRRRILAAFASEKSLATIAPDDTLWRRRIKAGLLVTAAALLVVALAGPRYGFVWQEVERKGVDIVVALDCSRSMLAEDVNPSRLDRAKREILDLLSIIQGDRMGLVAFAGEAFLQCPLTLDYGSFNIFLEALTPDYLPVGGTDLAGALTVSMDAFNSDDASDKAIILITDGESTDGKVEEAIKTASEKGIKIFTIGVGSREGVPVPDPAGGFKKGPDGSILLSKLDAETLKKMASVTGGTFVRSVAGDMDLEAIYTGGIRKSLEARSLTSSRKKVWENRYQWVLAVAILFLVIRLGLSDIRKNGAALLLLLVFLMPNLSEAKPLDLSSPVEKGMKAYADGDYEAALNHFIDGQLKDPTNPEMDFKIGSAHYRLGRFDEAAASFEAASRSEEAAQKAKSLFNLGNSRFKKGALEEAIKSWEAYGELKPEDTRARENIEFAKKKLEEKKEQQKKNDKNSDKDKKKSGQDQKNQKGDGEKGPNSDEKKSDKGEKPSPQRENPDKGQNDAQNQPEEGKDFQAQPGDKQDTPEQNDQEESGQAQGFSDEKPSDEEMKRAASALNRLQDKPGGALMRGAGRRHVEKDW